MMIAHFKLMARYNRWANDRLLEAAAKLTPEQLWEDKGVFFRSFLGTLNHLMVGDVMWMNRFEGLPPPEGWTLKTVVHRELEPFRTAREALDERIQAFTAAIAPEQLEAVLKYRTSAGQEVSSAFTPTLFHMFNHQTHHRGQAHGVLTTLGAVGPELDLIYFVRQGG
jgi:uncharacterized damage-inducible protein DinB